MSFYIPSGTSSANQLSHVISLGSLEFLVPKSYTVRVFIALLDNNNVPFLKAVKQLFSLCLLNHFKVLNTL